MGFSSKSMTWSGLPSIRVHPCSACGAVILRSTTNCRRSDPGQNAADWLRKPLDSTSIQGFNNVRRVFQPCWKRLYGAVVCHRSVVVASRQLRGVSPQSFGVIPSPPARNRADCPQASVPSVPAPWGWHVSRPSVRCQRRGGRGETAVSMSSTSTDRFRPGDRPWPRPPHLDAMPRFPMSR